MAVIHHGQIILEGTLAELKARHLSDVLFIEFASAADKVHFCEKAPEELLQKREDTLTELTLHVPNVAEAQRTTLKILSQNDILPLRLERLEPSIENLYLEVAQ